MIVWIWHISPVRTPTRHWTSWRGWVQLGRRAVVKVHALGRSQLWCQSVEMLVTHLSGGDSKWPYRSSCSVWLTVTCLVDSINGLLYPIVSLWIAVLTLFLLDSGASLWRFSFPIFYSKTPRTIDFQLSLYNFFASSLKNLWYYSVWFGLEFHFS